MRFSVKVQNNLLDLELVFQFGYSAFNLYPKINAFTDAKWCDLCSDSFQTQGKFGGWFNTCTSLNFVNVSLWIPFLQKAFFTRNLTAILMVDVRLSSGCKAFSDFEGLFLNLYDSSDLNGLRFAGLLCQKEKEKKMMNKYGKEPKSVAK